MADCPSLGRFGGFFPAMCRSIDVMCLHGMFQKSVSMSCVMILFV